MCKVENNDPFLRVNKKKILLTLECKERHESQK